MDMAEIKDRAATLFAAQTSQTITETMCGTLSRT
jgi:hypothetical protein